MACTCIGTYVIDVKMKTVLQSLHIWSFLILK